MCADGVEEFSIDKTYASCIIAGMYFTRRLETGSDISNARSHVHFVHVQKGFPVDRYGDICFNATKLEIQLYLLETQAGSSCIYWGVPCLPRMTIFFQEINIIIDGGSIIQCTGEGAHRFICKIIGSRSSIIAFIVCRKKADETIDDEMR